MWDDGTWLCWAHMISKQTLGNDIIFLLVGMMCVCSNYRDLLSEESNYTSVVCVYVITVHPNGFNDHYPYEI